MNIKISEGLAEIANIGISSIAIVLTGLFKRYTQASLIDAAEKLTTGQVVLPILLFEPIKLQLKSKTFKTTTCDARFIVYSKQPDSPDECLRFIHAERCIDKGPFLEKIPAAILDAFTDAENESTLLDLISTLSGIDADKVTYFYSAIQCDYVTTHSIGIVHEFGKDSPYCTATTYLSIIPTK